MQLIHEHRSPDILRDIASAVQEECESDADGALEQAHDAATRTGAFLGRLVELLHAKGVLGDQEVVDLLGDGWKLCNEGGG